MAALVRRLDDALLFCFLPLGGMTLLAMWPEVGKIKTSEWVLHGCNIINGRLQGCLVVAPEKEIDR